MNKPRTDTRIRLILLDFDGTLADTRRANTLAYLQTLAEAGIPLSEEEYAARYFGMRCSEFLASLGIADPAERERLRRRKSSSTPATSTACGSTVRCGSSAASSSRAAAGCGSSRRGVPTTSAT